MERTRKVNLLLYVTVAIYIMVMLFIKVFQIQLPMLLGLSLSQILIILPTIGYFIITKKSPLKLIRHQKMKLSVLFLVVVMAFLLIPIVTFVNSISLLFVENEVTELMTTLTSLPFVTGLFFIAILPAFVEEFVFRGVYYHTYLQNGVWKGIFLSAFIFGLMHLNINQFSYAFILGVFLAITIEATGSIVSAMIIHFIINGNSYVLSYLLNMIETETPAATTIDATIFPIYFITVAFLFVVAAICLVLVMLLYKKIAKISGRQAYFNALWKRQVHPPQKEHTIDAYLGLAILLCIVEMLR